ncbi:hypothetical protein [Streptomyces avicenniae]|uniref:hypothetical protein n=1 Tax=Streptomyces avicenniae TaxID=500153 RepID=UPI00069ADCDC|nr:hypothetical protein [Streptomyces avicenniae]
MPSEDIAATAARRTLRSRLRTPVGKAIALAAMPSAALLGIGIGSPLAKAEPQPPNPFQDRPCVEMPDGAEPETDGAAEQGPEQEPEPEPESDQGAADAPDADADPDPDPTAPVDEAEPDERPVEDTGPTEATGSRAPGPEDAAAPEDRPEDTGEPWDPLGLGQGLSDLGHAVGDLLTPGRGADGGSGGGTDEGATPPPAAPSEPGRPEDPAETPEDPADEQGSGDPGLPEEPAQGAPDDTGADETSGTSGTSGTTGSGGEDDATPADPFAPDAQGRLPYPCPEERSVPGSDEALPVVLPDEGWYLEATYLTLRGLDYEGVVNVTTAGGGTKQALKFTADQLDVGDLHQIVDGEGALRYHVGTATGSNSTFRNGRVTMYTERLEGNLFGVIPIVFDPEHEPPLDIAFAFFTDVFVHQAGQFGGDLTLHGMEIYTTEDGPTVPGGGRGTAQDTGAGAGPG